MPFSGAIWDCLSLPVLHRLPGQIKRILLLGVGGGAVIRQLQTLGDFESITAVEIDAVHLDIARKWFGVTGAQTSLLHADAIDWLYHYDGEGFDLIIDDLFGHSSGEPQRACPLELLWLEQLRRHLNGNGLLVVNCIDSKELIHALPEIGASGFSFGYRWHLPTYENVIGIFTNTSIHARQWSRNLENSSLALKIQRQARQIVRRPIRGLELYQN